MTRFKFLFSSAFFVSIIFSLLAITPGSATAQILSCENANILVRPSSTQSGTSSVIVTPANSKNIIVDIKFQSNIASSSNCLGYARIFYKWKNTVDSIEINKNMSFSPFSSNMKEGEYIISLQLAQDKDFKLIYFDESVKATVAKDILNPPVSNTNTVATNSNSSNSNSNTGAPPPDTNVSASLGSLDETIGNFFNPLEKDTLPELMASVLRILFAIIGMLAVIVIIVAGFRMVLSSGDPTGVANAKKAITAAIAGLVLSLMAFSIVAIVQRLIQG